MTSIADRGRPEWELGRADFRFANTRNSIDAEALNERDVFHYSIPVVQEIGTGQIENGDTIDSSKLLIQSPVVLISKLNPRKSTVCLAEPHAETLTVASGEFVPLDPVQDDIRYIYYVWSSELMRQHLSALVKSVTKSHQRCNPADIVKVPWRWPSKLQQEAIAHYLDRRCGEIDDLIAKKRGLLGLLAEKRSALITRAVTKGLDPTAATSADRAGENEATSALASIFAPMIAERFGKLQPGWSFRRLKEVADLKSGAGFPIEYQNVQDEEFGFYKVADLGRSEDGVFMPSANHTVSRDTAAELRARIIPANSVLYAKIGAALLLNKRRVNTVPCCIDNNMTAMICNSDLIHYKYAFYWMQTLDFAEYMNPGAVPSFSEGYQAHLPILVPPLEVQRHTAEVLDTELSEIDRSMSLIERAIDKLTEYRAAIITKAVTGELEVI